MILAGEPGACSGCGALFENTHTCDGGRQVIHVAITRNDWQDKIDLLQRKLAVAVKALHHDISHKQALAEIEAMK